MAVLQSDRLNLFRLWNTTEKPKYFDIWKLVRIHDFFLKVSFHGKVGIYIYAENKMADLRHFQIL